MQPTKAKTQKPQPKPQPKPQTPPPPPKAWWQRINEDWWSVIVGMALIALVAAGVISSVPW